MTFVGQSSPQGRTRYQVQDVGRIVAIIFSGIFWSAVAYGCFYYLDQYKLFYANGDGWTTAAHSFNLTIHYGFVLNDLPKELLPLLAVGILIVATLFAVRAVFRLAANFRGIVVDFDRGSISYPGGGVIRNTFGDLFRLRFMFQTCYRFETPLDQIRMIEPRNLTVTRQGGSGFAGGVAESLSPGSTIGQTHTDRYYFLDFNGCFGAVSLSFSSEGKRDEVYSFIRQYQRMGIPVVRA